MENAQKTPLEISNKAFIWEFPACFRERAGKTHGKTRKHVDLSMCYNRSYGYVDSENDEEP